MGGEEYRVKQGRVQDEKGGKGREKEEKREKMVQEGGYKAGAISWRECIY